MMASHGAGAAAGSDAAPAEVNVVGHTNPSLYLPITSAHHSWPSSTGAATVSWNYPQDNPSQDAIYYDPQRDVSVPGSNENVASSAPHNVQPSMDTENATHFHVPHSSSLQHGYSPAEYANYYYNYPQTTNDSSVQQGGANQHSDCARIWNEQLLLSEQHMECSTTSGHTITITLCQILLVIQLGTVTQLQTPLLVTPVPVSSHPHQELHRGKVIQVLLLHLLFRLQVLESLKINIITRQSRHTSMPQNNVNLNPVQQSNNGDQQKTVFVTPETSNENKVQVPRIAPGFSMVIPKSEKKILGADLAKKPTYVSVSMLKNGTDARSLPFSLRNYATRNFNHCKDEAQRAACQSMIEEIKNKAIADGTLLTKNWDTEPLLPLLGSVATIKETSIANNSSLSVPSSTFTHRRRLKTRWEPVVEDKVMDKVEPIKGFANGNTHSNLEAKNIMSNSWDSRKALQSHQAPAIKVSQRRAKKQKMSSYSGLMQNGNASSDSDKDQDLTKYYASATALANSPEEKKRREHRSKRFEKNLNSSSKSKNSAASKDVIANVHARKAVSALLTRSCEDGTSLAVEDMDWDALTVKGTCQEIEKQYLRLTSAPDPATVRPEHVLEKALSMVETSQKNYLYKCDQLKSIRQDLTVQRIQDKLTVKVYETHARLAMQAGDLPEYNQCQSQLKRLYIEGIKGCYFEFSAYNLLCVMLHSNNKRDLLSSLASLSKEAKQNEAVKHALAVHSAVSSGNYVQFFKLYNHAPNLNSCLMDLYVERMRFEAVKCMSKSYRPTVPVGYVGEILGFLRTNSEASEDCEIWLKAHGAILSVDSSGDLQLDTKASAATLFMPEPENAVAHGDASLAVNDFLART
ncbi:hypothetical protein GUJ93_ZPchr0079g2778 [Zizania palustris]|uniref:PCI domain-containing protein n=1 Tax=Zizania palustris TaxID=103762 RepID=A0A8J5V396_ZIZPA|nr:hypothetical protein GUJ93_ZPchr0079g2778 [Zizania palustris]